RLRDLDPRLAQHHGGGDVRPAQADGEGAHPAVRGGVRVRAEHHLPGLHEVPVELGVQDGDVGVVEVAELRLGGEVAGELGQLLRALVGGEGDRVDGVVDGEEEAVRVVD